MDLFKLSSLFAPVTINRNILKNASGINPSDIINGKRFDRAIIRLNNLGLVQNESDGRILIHRLLGAFGRSMFDNKEDFINTLGIASNSLAEFAEEVNKQYLIRELIPEVSHIHYLAKKTEQLKPENAGLLYTHLGYHLLLRGAYVQAKEFQEKALSIALTTLQEDDPIIAIIISNIGSSLWYLGNHLEAHEYFNRALSIDEQVYGRNSIQVADDFNNIGVAYLAQEQYDVAIEYLENAIDIFLSIYGEEHFTVANLYNNIGVCLQKKEEFDDALVLFHNALRIDEETYGHSHPKVALRMNNIGLLLFEQEEYIESLEYFEEAYRIWIEHVGKDHPDTKKAFEYIQSIKKCIHHET